MEIKNVERASSLLAQYQQLTLAKKILSEEDVTITVSGTSDVILPLTLRNNILNIVNCEYELLRKEIQRL